MIIEVSYPPHSERPIKVYCDPETTTLHDLYVQVASTIKDNVPEGNVFLLETIQVYNEDLIYHGEIPTNYQTIHSFLVEKLGRADFSYGMHTTVKIYEIADLDRVLNYLQGANYTKFSMSVSTPEGEYYVIKTDRDLSVQGMFEFKNSFWSNKTKNKEIYGYTGQSLPTRRQMMADVLGAILEPDQTMTVTAVRLGRPIIVKGFIYKGNGKTRELDPERKTFMEGANAWGRSDAASGAGRSGSPVSEEDKALAAIFRDRRLAMKPGADSHMKSFVAGYTTSFLGKRQLVDDLTDILQKARRQTERAGRR